MLDLIIAKFHDPKFLTMALAAVAGIATVLTLAMPLLSPDTLANRMKAVSVEREKIRQRERERLARASERGSVCGRRRSSTWPRSSSAST